MSSADKTIILITGANGGLGFELAAQLLADSSKHILLGSRSTEKGKAAVKDLQSRNLPGDVELLTIDVTSQDSISAAAKTVEIKFGRLDALVNNAGIASSTGTLAEQMSACFVTNAIGPRIVLDTFIPLLLKASSGTPRVVNVSSGAGSITLRSKETSRSTLSIAYRMSKAALNMVTVDQAVDMGAQGFKIFAYCPGYCVSGLTYMNITEYGAKPISEGARPLVGILKGERDAEHGCFLKKGGQYPW